jgi:hypothetical protein
MAFVFTVHQTAFAIHSYGHCPICHRAAALCLINNYSYEKNVFTPGHHDHAGQCKLPEK